MILWGNMKHLVGVMPDLRRDTHMDALQSLPQKLWLPTLGELATMP